MSWRVIHGRQRALFVRGAELGKPQFTTEARQALQFRSADEARRWIEGATATPFGELALLRDADPRERDPERKRDRAANHYGPRR